MGGGGAQTSCQEKRQYICQISGKSGLKLTNLRCDSFSRNTNNFSQNLEGFSGSISVSSRNANSTLQNFGSCSKSVDVFSQNIDNPSQNFKSYSESVGGFSRNSDNSSWNFGSFSQVFGNYSQNPKKYAHRCSFRTRFLAGFIGLFKARLTVTFFLFAATIKTTLISTLLVAVVNCHLAKSSKIILLPAFFSIFSLKKVLCNCLIFRVFHDSLASFGRPALWGRLQRPHSGAILILFALFIPIILGGIRYSEHLFERRWKILEKYKNTEIEKFCAKKAALAVARNWNPGLTFAQQKEGVYKIADYIYNKTPGSLDSVVGRSIPGIHPGNIKNFNSKKEVSQNIVTRYHHWLYATSITLDFKWNPNYVSWLFLDKITAFNNRQSIFDEIEQSDASGSDCSLIHQNIIDFFRVSTGKFADGYPNNFSHNSGETFFSCFCPCAHKCGDHKFEEGNKYNVFEKLKKTYGVDGDFGIMASERLSDTVVRSDGPDSNYVEISIVEDTEHLGKIKVRTDKDEAYAIPAHCNVDIVLAVPTNSDVCSDTNNMFVDDAYFDERQSLIYQIGQACSSMIKEHFFYTRGVYMSLIPYSGKLSVSPDRALDWTVPFSQYKANTDQGVIIGACLYSTSGLQDALLEQSYKANAIAGTSTNDTTYIWGGPVTGGCPIMFRAGVEVKEDLCFQNPYYIGLLCDDSDPKTNSNSKYLRMNLNPCHAKNADLINGACKKTCTYFLPNPYYLIEPTADLVKIYEMCKGLFSISDSYNHSNFIFPIFEWANNFFSNWTNDPGKSTIVGMDTSIETTLGCNSKTASHRKKAIILIVNKPDYFAANELTYIGFTDDANKIPTKDLTDTIDFSKNFGNNPIQGDNKILKFFGDVEYGGPIVDGNRSSQPKYGVFSESSKLCRLILPFKANILLEVEPANFTEYEKSGLELYSPGCSIGALGVGPIAPGREDAMIMTSWSASNTRYAAYSFNGIKWIDLPDAAGSSGLIVNQPPVYGNGVWVRSGYSRNGVSTQYTTSLLSGNWVDSAPITHSTHYGYGNGKFMLLNEDELDWNDFTYPVYISNDGANWVKMGKLPDGDIVNFIFGGDMWLAFGRMASCYSSKDNGQNWTELHPNLITGYINNKGYEYYTFMFANGYFWTCPVDCAGTLELYKSIDGENWSLVTSVPSSFEYPQFFYGAYYNGKLYLPDNYKYCWIGTFNPTWVKFTSCSTDKIGKNVQFRFDSDGRYASAIFRIEPEQFPSKNADGVYEITFDLCYARLIKATAKISRDLVLLENQQENMVLKNELRDEFNANDPTENVKKVTTKFCKKLKTDYGKNIRIYVVEYGVPVGADLAYVEQCAASTGGSIKKPENAAQLKRVLDEIADEIKTWGGYQEARLVS